jgi:hypothetical protein
VVIIDGENEDPRIGGSGPLGSIGRTHVEKTAVGNGFFSVKNATHNKEED